MANIKNKHSILIAVTNDLSTDQRVHKVASFLERSGWNVTLVGRLLPHSLPLNRSYKTKRFRLFFNKGALFYANYNLRLFLWLIFQRKTTAILSNDLDTLLACFLASKMKNSTVYYDSHELYTEVPELTKRPRVRKVWLAIEKWIFPKLKNVYTVNHSIAEIYQEKYRVPIRVVRNVSPLWQPKSRLSRIELGLPEDKDIIILQGAGINIDRGAEEAVAAMHFVSNAVLVFVGSGDVLPLLKKKVAAEKLEDKVIFIGKKPYEEMMQYTHHASLGLTLDKDTNANYRYSLPNKVFDYMHAGTPIVASNLVEIRRLIEQHDIGRIIASHDPKDIAACIQQLLNDKGLLRTLKENCLIAAKKEHWEVEEKVLMEIYRQGE
ncbi:MAG: glycosyltransferase [Crocinitomicaceae bacterium]|nr:glycosyltransferase [Crocinitomicaceae bacterium]